MSAPPDPRFSAGERAHAAVVDAGRARARGRGHDGRDGRRHQAPLAARGGRGRADRARPGCGDVRLQALAARRRRDAVGRRAAARPRAARRRRRGRRDRGDRGRRPPSSASSAADAPVRLAAGRAAAGRNAGRTRSRRSRRPCCRRGRRRGRARARRSRQVGRDARAALRPGDPEPARGLERGRERRRTARAAVASIECEEDRDIDVARRRAPASSTPGGSSPSVAAKSAGRSTSSTRLPSRMPSLRGRGVPEYPAVLTRRSLWPAFAATGQAS